MLKVKKRFLWATVVLVAFAFLVLVLRIGFPAHRGLSIVLYVLSCVAFLFSFRGKAELIRRSQKAVSSWRFHVVIGLLLLFFAYTAWVLVPVEHTELLEYSDAELSALIEQDLKVIAYLAYEDRLPLSIETWPAWREQLVELELLALRYKGFYQIDYLKKPVLHATAFLAGYAALQARAKCGFELVAQVKDADLEVRLNEKVEALGIPGYSFFRIKRRLTHGNQWIRLHAGRAYLDVVDHHLEGKRSIVAVLKKGHASLTKHLSKNPDLVLGNPLEDLERRAFKRWFPVQRSIALGMSHVRAWDDAFHLTPVVLAEVRAQLLPGDILLERRSGYMTNLGVPGFWSHAVLYIGTPEEYVSLYGEEALRSLEGRFSEAVGVWRTDDEGGYPRRIIEAKRPGVILTSLEDSAACDHLVALRPRLSVAQKGEAVGVALSHFGKPYDFNFDFASDEALVCSELVYKALSTVGAFPLALKMMNGRSMLAPHAMAVDAAKGEGFFEVICFYEKNHEGHVGACSAADFLGTLKRPKWYGLSRR